MIEVNCINLENRPERKKHILTEFSGRDEFKLQIITAIKHDIGSIGLWQSLQSVVRRMQENDIDFFIFCEDDHTFTKSYSLKLLHECIKNATYLNADILLGGISWVETAVQVSDHLFWINKYTGNQFMVIFKKFYPSILEINDLQKTSADYKISEISDNKFVIFPFISIQKEFGYSDATVDNNYNGRVDFLFKTTLNKFIRLDKVKKYFFNLSK